MRRKRSPEMKQADADKIWSILQDHKTKESAIHIKDLAEQAGIPPDRSHTSTDPYPRSLIRDLNMGGKPVVSANDGYWIAQTAAEVEEYAVSLEGRTRKVRERVDALRQIIVDQFSEGSP